MSVYTVTLHLCNECEDGTLHPSNNGSYSGPVDFFAFALFGSLEEARAMLRFLDSDPHPLIVSAILTDASGNEVDFWFPSFAPIEYI